MFPRIVKPAAANITAGNAATSSALACAQISPMLPSGMIGPRSSFCIRCLGCAVILFIAGRGAVAEPAAAPPLTEAWHDLSIYLANDAYRIFHAATQQDPASREARYGEALALLNYQPKTAGRIAEAAQLFDQLRAENADDGIGIASLYFRARLEQAQRDKPDLPRALAFYARLAREHPRSPFAQRALIKIAVIRLYAPGLDAAALAGRFAECEAFAAQITDPALLGEYHRAMADAYQRLRHDDRDALPHLLASFPCGTPNLQSRADLEVRIGETARALGDNTTALAYYRMFLAEFPGDIRAYAIRQFQQQLEAGPAAPAAASAP